MDCSQSDYKERLETILERWMTCLGRSFERDNPYLKIRFVACVKTTAYSVHMMVAGAAASVTGASADLLTTGGTEAHPREDPASLGACPQAMKSVECHRLLLSCQTVYPKGIGRCSGSPSGLPVSVV